MDEDFFLIRRIRAGSEDAAEAFVRKYYDDITGYCGRKLGDSFQAEDAAQQTFLQFLSAVSRYEHRGKAKNYLYVIAGNICRNSYASVKAVSLEQTASEPAYEGFQTVSAERISIEQAVLSLPDELREVIWLHYFQELKIKEISAITGITQSNIKYRLKHAKDRLACLLRKEDFDL